MNINPVASQNPSFNAMANMGTAIKHSIRGTETIKNLMLNTDHIVSAESIVLKDANRFGVRVKTILNEVFDLSYPKKDETGNEIDKEFRRRNSYQGINFAD